MVNVNVETKGKTKLKMTPSEAIVETLVAEE